MGRCILTVKLVEASDEGVYMAKIDDNNFTKCNVYVVEPRFEFTVPLKSVKVQEKEHAVLECEINDKDYDVEWWHDDIKVTIDGQKFEYQKVSRKRKLIVKNAAIEDEGVYKCTTKDDKTMCQLIVEAVNKLVEKLKDQTGVEKDEIMFQCQTKDTRGSATWYRNGRIITSVPGSKYESKSKMGTHQLIIRKLELTDQDTYEVEIGDIRCTAKLTVLEAEKKPIINWKPKKVEAVAEKPLILKIPYSIKGTKKADPEIVLLKHGKPIDLKDPKCGIEIKIHPDSIEIIYKSPQKGDTGPWEMVMTNSAGTANAPFELGVKGM